MSGKRISTQQVEEIVALYEEGLTQRQIATKLKLSLKTVNKKVQGLGVLKGKHNRRLYTHALNNPFKMVSASSFARKMLQTKAKIVVRKTIDAAVDGKEWALKLLFERIVPVPKIAPVSLELKQGKNISEVKQNIDTILEKLSVGELIGDEVKPFLDIFELQRKVIEKEQIVRELERLEALVPTKN